MIYIDKENAEIIMLIKYMDDRSNTNKEEIEIMKNDLKRAMKRLSKSQKKVVEMYYYEGKNDYEIADELGKSRPNITRTRNNAIKKMRDIIDERI